MARVTTSVAKKVFKSVGKLATGAVGTILGVGKKKKAAAEPIEGQPIITPLAADTETGRRLRRKARTPLGGGSILSDTLGG